MREITGKIRAPTLKADVYRATVVLGESTYDGAYSVTPGDTAQILATANKTLIQDVIIEPVPDNYGKIGWNGSVLTVS